MLGVLDWAVSLVLLFCLMKSSSTDRAALISTCFSGPNSVSVNGMLLFTVLESE